MEDEPTAAVLVLRAQQGDRSAFATLVERYQQALGSYLWRLTRDRELASDLTQETFLRAYRSIGSNVASLQVRPWLYRIATNLAYDEFRRRSRLRRLQVARLATPPGQEACSMIEERELVQLALEQLRPKDRAILLLCVVEQHTYAEVCAIVGGSSEAVRKQFMRAKEHFRIAYAAVVTESLAQAS